jgi:hypothetical protein
MIYFKDIDYNSLEILTTTNISEAAHFEYEDQSSLSALDVIVFLLRKNTGIKWRDIRDQEDEDNRYVIVHK